jgi:hypothetical protein
MGNGATVKNISEELLPGMRRALQEMKVNRQRLELDDVVAAAAASTAKEEEKKFLDARITFQLQEIAAAEVELEEEKQVHQARREEGAKGGFGGYTRQTLWLG